MFNFLQFLAEIIKSPTKVVVSFGRLNPITTGHEKLVEKMIAVAKAKKAKPILFLSQSQDSKKNPLSWKDKTKLAKKAFPDITISTDATMKNLFQIAGKLSDNGTKEFYLVVGSDRVEEFKRQLSKYVGATSGALILNFDKFEVISAGVRDEGSDSVAGMSASKMRQYVKDNNIDTFKGGLPKRLKSDYINIFELIKTGLKL